ncbi:hypothetical protein [Mucilaginibacter sp.]
MIKEYLHPASIPENFNLLRVFYHGQITQCSEEIIRFDLSQVDTEILDHLAKACVFECLARAGCAYEYTAMERKHGVGIDYFKALKMAADKGKTIISTDTAKERERAGIQLNLYAK